MLRTLAGLLLIGAVAVTSVPAFAAQSYPTTTERRERARARNYYARRSTITPYRVYDPYRRDTHYWNARERQTYRNYLAQRRRTYVGYQRQSVAQQRAYWQWRHAREERLEHRR